jgi:hypothetical protein
MSKRATHKKEVDPKNQTAPNKAGTSVLQKALFGKALPKLFRLAKIMFPLFVCGVLIGIGVGKHFSPDYNDPAEIAKYVAAYVKAPEPHLKEYKEQFTELGQLSSFKPPDAELSFECEITRYSYFPGKPLPKPKGIGVPTGKTHRRRLDFEGAMVLLYGGVESFKFATQYPKFVKTVQKAEPEEKLEYLVAGSLAILSGLALGINIGYDDSPNCTSAAFVENLGKEPFWESVYEEYMKNRSLFMVYDKFGFPQLDKSKGIGATLSSKHRADVVTVINSKDDFESTSWDSMLFREWLPLAIREVSHNHVPSFWVLENQLVRSDPDAASMWEDAITSWCRERGPVAARILVDKRFKGDVMVVLRHWIIDGDNVQKVDFVSPPSIQRPGQLMKELESLNWGTSRYYVPMAKHTLLDMHF